VAAGVVTREGSRTISPEGNAAPPGEYDTWDDYMLDVEADARRENAWRRDEEANQGLKAMRLAPTLAIYRALVNGEDVPREHLDPLWVRRYRL
jgi:hypothetical protein